MRLIRLLSSIFYIWKHRDSSIKSLHIDGSVQIGSSCIIKRGVGILSGAKVGTGCKLFENVLLGRGVVLGDFTSINRNTIIDCALIGNFCSVGPNCHIGAGKHAVEYISTSQYIYGSENILGLDSSYNPYDKPAMIGHDVWIGTNAVIMQGVTIGDGCVIGSNAVVTKDVLPYKIVGGVPAIELKKRFSNETINFLNNMKIFNDYKANMNLIRKIAELGSYWENIL